MVTEKIFYPPLPLRVLPHAWGEPLIATPRPYGHPSSQRGTTAPGSHEENLVCNKNLCNQEFFV